MPKPIVVPIELYRRIEQAPAGVDVEGFVHPHGKNHGPREIVASGKKPLKCTVLLSERRVERQGVKDTRVAMIFRRK